MRSSRPVVQSSSPGVHGTAPSRSRALSGGVLAGIAGGLVLYLIMAIQTLSAGGSLWSIFKGAALPFFGAARVGTPGFDLAPIVVGIIAHFAIAIGWAVLFAALFYGLSKGTTLVAGVFWGIVVWLAMFFVVLPLVGAGMVTRAAPVWPAILQHIAYGVTVAAVFLPFQRRRPRRTSRVPPRVDAGRHAPVTP